MKRVFSLILGVIFLVGLCACGVGESVPTWQEQYDLGVRYLSEGNYEEAVIAFTAAIGIDPKRPEAYSGAADAYIGLGDYEKAIDILMRGQERCGELGDFARRINNIDFLQSGDIGIRITDFYFDREEYLSGGETDFLVSVAYRCPEGVDCIVMIGANTNQPDSFAMMDKDYAVTGSGGYQFHVSVTPVQWENAYFGIYVNLSEADHADTWTPFASDTLYIDPDGDVSDYSDVNTYEPDQANVLVARVDNPLTLGEINFLGHSIENLDIETARALIKQNFQYVSEQGFDDDSESWWISGSHQQFGPSIHAFQEKTDSYVCIWEIDTAFYYSDQKQLRTVRDIYTYDTLSEVLMKLGVTNGDEIADRVKGILGQEYASFDELYEAMDFIQWPQVDGMSMYIHAGGGPVTDSGGFVSTEVTISIDYWDESNSYDIDFHFGENAYVEYMYQFVDYLDVMSVYVRN